MDNVGHGGVDDVPVLQSEACGRCVRACRVEHGDRTTTDWHLPHGNVVLPVEIHAVGDEVAMAVGHVDVLYLRADIDRWSPGQGNAPDRDGSRCRRQLEEVSPPNAVDLCEDDVTESRVRLAPEDEFLTRARALGGPPYDGSVAVV
ncbi:MAG: hypothetical protein ACJ797_07620 [Ktedonobacteraceae bacterium]